MSNINIIRAWKDAEYRSSLSSEELAMLPENPAGEIVLSDQDLASVAGADSYRCSHFVCISIDCNSAIVCISYGGC